MGVSRIFLGEAKTTFCLSVIRLLTIATQIDVRKTLFPFCAIKKMSVLRQQLQTVFPLRKLTLSNCLL